MYQKGRQGLLFTLAAVLTGATLLAGVGIYLLLKTLDTSDTKVAPEDISTVAPVDTSVPPLEPEPPPAITSQKNEPDKNLGGVNWQGRDLRLMNLRSANLGGANLNGANLSGVDLSGAILSGANLAKANLRNANLSKADLRGANLSDANLDGANLNGAFLDGANLPKAVNLR